MTIASIPSGLKAQLHSAHMPSRREAHAGLGAALFTASGKRLRYRVHLLWQDNTVPSGRREEVIQFRHPGRLLDLLHRVCDAPDRTLLDLRLEAQPAPRWESVGLPFLTWRAAEHKRKGGAR